MKTLFTPLFLFLTLSLSAQNFMGKEAQKKVENAEQVIIDKETGTIEFIQFDSQVSAKSKGVKQPQKSINEILPLSNGCNFKEIRSFKDQLGHTHVKYQQVCNGMPVEGMVFNFHYKNGILNKANGQYTNTNIPAAQPALNYDQALEKALNTVKAETYNFSNNPKIDQDDLGTLVYLNKDEQVYLSYKFDIYAYQPLARYYVYIDAKSGDLLKKISRIHDQDTVGTAVTMYMDTLEITTDYYNGSFRLRETGRGNGIETYDMNRGSSYTSAVDFTDADNFWDVTTNYDNAALDAHVNTEATYDYYLNKHGRNSFDNNGATLKSYVHYGSGYVNAFWDGQRMTYGDGDGMDYFPLTCTDIVAHEITHGVTEYTANLEYAYESGALNESFSDIFGVCVDFYQSPDEANWDMGEQISATNTPIRSMSNPNLYGDPDTYLGDYWHSSSSDNGGVHTNSGVQNYWFYLLVNGGSGVNDHGDAYNVTGIGIEKAAQIAYRNLTVYLGMNSQYSDARFYGIQAALDLFGECSQEVISVTNAWHAVGVGEAYSNSVIAEFRSPTYACTYPIEITFTNLSQNADSVIWDFGDGSTDTTWQPTHTYSDTGFYSVQLIVHGTGQCNDVDTIFKEDYIYVSDMGAPVDPVCTPSTTIPGSYGIYSVDFNTIHHTSIGSSEGYQDHSCNYVTTVQEGKVYPLSIQTSSGLSEDVKMWIDLDNDSSFSSTELVYQSSARNIHSTELIIPEGMVYDTLLRVRIISDSSGISVPNACTDPMFGQVEDYGIIIQENSEKPESEFSKTDNFILSGDTVEFVDKSLNIPTSWVWAFPGGTPSSSTDQNPEVVYSSTGFYDVALIVSNAYGSDTITKSNYISVGSEHVMCTDASSQSLSGILFDSGGENGDYSNGENCSFLINPDCADSITLSFEYFDLEGCCDHIRVYDGDSEDGDLLLYTDYNTPNTVTAHSGAMYITFSSDGSVTRDGFEAHWEANSKTDDPLPIANFSVSSENQPFNAPVQFTDSTLNGPIEWQWDFGDDSISYEQHPEHAYLSSGDFEVKLTATSCSGVDSISKTITIQEAPMVSINTDTIELALLTGDTVNHYLTIDNSAGAGDYVGQASIVLLNDFKGTIKSNRSSIGFNAHHKEDTGQMDLPIPNDYGIKPLIETDSTHIFDNVPSNISGMKKIGNSLFLVDTYDDMLIKYDLPSETIVANYNIHNRPFGITYDGEYLWIGSYNGNVYGYDLEGNQIGSFSAPFSDETALSYSNDHFLIARSFNTDHIYEVDYDNTIINTYEWNYNKPVFELTYDDYNDSYFIVSEAQDRFIFKAEIENNAFIIKDTVDINPNTFAYNLSYDDEMLYWSYFYGNQAIGVELVNYNKWIHIEYPQITVQNNAIDSLKIFFDATDMFGGMYRASINIAGNDTSQAEHQIPVKLDVTGIPMISFNPDSVSLDTVYTNYSRTRTLEIYNPGTEALVVDTLLFTADNFNYSGGIPDIAPRESHLVDITYSSASPATHHDTCLVINNSGNDTAQVILHAVTVDPPEITVDPETISVDLFTDDTLTSYLTINNTTGGSRLDFTMDITEAVSYLPSNLDGINILFYDVYNYYVRDSLLNLGADLYQDSYPTEEMIDSMDVLIIGDYSDPSPSLRTYINNWVYEGGNLMICDDIDITYFNEILEGSGMVFAGYSCRNGFDNTIYDHPVSDTITSYEIRYAYASIVDSSAIDVIIHDDYYDRNHAAAGKYGDGRIVGITSPVFENTSAFNNIQLGINAIKWLAGYNWLSIENRKGSVQAGESVDVPVSFNAEDLFGSVYNKNIRITSNDSVNTVVNVPVQMNVTGIPQIALQPDSVFFDTVYVDFNRTRKLEIYNPGTDTLQVDTILFSSDNFSTSQEIPVIPARESFVMDIEFSSTEPGIYYDTCMVINNSENDTAMAVVYAISVDPPVIFVDPELVAVDMFTDDTLTSYLTIDNTAGGSRLDYSMRIIDTSSYLTDDLEGVKILFYDYYASNVRDSLENLGALVYEEYYPTQEMIDTMDILVIGDNSDPSTNMMSFINNWIFEGGKLIISDDGEISDYNTMLEGSGLEFLSTDCDYGFDNTISSHPIMQNIGTYEITNAYASFIDTSTIDVLIWDYYNRVYAATTYYGEGKIVGIASRALANNWATNNLKLGMNAIKWLAGNNWLAIDNKSGSVEAGESFDVSLKFDAEDLFGGVYTKNIQIYSNDSVNALVNVPVEMNVTGIPQITVQPIALDFDTVYVNMDRNRQFEIYNPGTDVLQIDSVLFSSEDFSVVGNIPDIPARESYIATIQFNANELISYNDSCWIINNSATDSVALSLHAEVIDPPVITVDPESITADLYTNDTLSTSITINNITGGSRLDYRIDVADANSDYLPNDLSGTNILFNNVPNSDVRDSLWMHGASYYNIYGGITQAMLDTFDILVVGDYTYPSSSEIDVINQWVHDGGSLMLTGRYDNYVFNRLSEGSGINYSPDNCYSGITHKLNEHPINDTMTNYYVTYAYLSIIDNDSINVLIRDVNNNIYAATSSYGNGKIVAVSARVFQYSMNHLNNNGYFAYNAIKWLAGNDWIDIEDIQGSVPAGESVEVPVQLHATDMFGGQYNQNIIISSNDSVNSRVIVPVQLNVTGIPQIELEPNTLDFDTVYLNMTRTRELTISNPGTDSLHINDIIFSSDKFSIQGELPIIPYNQSVTIPVVFKSDEVKAYHDEYCMIINDSQDDTVVVDLSAVSVEAPEIQVSPGMISELLLNNSSNTRYLTISNMQGGSRLDYSLKVNSTEGNLPDDLDGLKVLSANSEYLAFMEMLRLLGADTYHNTTLTQALVDSMDVVIIGDYTLTSTYMREYLNQWIKDGGNLVVNDDGNMNLFNQVLDGTGISFNSANCYSGITGNLGDHPIVDSMQNYEISYGYISINESDTMDVLIRDSYNRIYSAASEYGLGKVVAISSRSFDRTSDYNNLQFGVNVMKWFNGVGWVTPARESGSVLAGQKDSIALAINSGDLALGNYTATINVFSNDSVSPVVAAEINLEVTDNQYPKIINPVDYITDYITMEEMTIDFNHIFNEPDNDVMYFDQTSQHDSIVAFNRNGSELTLTYQNAGKTRIYLEATDQYGLSSVDTFTIEILENHAPALMSGMQDTSQNINESVLFTLNLTDIFHDEDGDDLFYNITSGNPNVATISTYDSTDTEIIVIAQGIGFSIMDITASDGKSIKKAKDKFILVFEDTPITSVDGFGSETGIHVYPNPASQWINIELPSDSPSDIKIYDVTGQKLYVRRVFTKSVNIDVDRFADGMYLIQVNQNDKEEIIKLIIE